MAEVNLLRIKSCYSEINGIYANISADNNAYVPERLVLTYNNELIPELNSLTLNDFSRYKVPIDDISDSNGDCAGSQVKMSLGPLLARLENDYEFKVMPEVEQRAPVIISVNQQQQQAQVTFTSIHDLISSQTDDEIIKILRSIEVEMASKKSSKTIKPLLKSLMDKSWDVFVALIPVILDYSGSLSD